MVKAEEGTISIREFDRMNKLSTVPQALFR
jgi:DNA replicative helicase MCM subunit Mcm2 (Cdc46/Mcm family)